MELFIITNMKDTQWRLRGFSSVVSFAHLAYDKYKGIGDIVCVSIEMKSVYEKPVMQDTCFG